MKKPRMLYIASPLGFSELTRRHYFADLVTPLTVLGWRVSDPWESTYSKNPSELFLESRSTVRDAALEVGLRNMRMIRKSNLVLAVLDGPDVDAGVASEIGFASALKKRIIGYRGDFRPSGDFSSSRVNVQVEAFIHASGGKIYGSLAELFTALARLK